MSYKFVLITDEYIDYLRKTEPRVMSNKAGERIYHRKYLGIIEELNGHKYFIPLSSPKPKDYAQNGKPKFDTLVTIYIKGSISSFFILNSGKDCKGWHSQFRSVAKE